MFGNGCIQSVDTEGYVLDAAGIAPVALGREVDDEPGMLGAGVEDMHAARGKRAGAAGIGIGREVFGEVLLELEREPGSHDADAVDGIDDGLAVGVEDVARGVVQHG